ncbi:MAG: protein kinase [Acidobacteriota bacterium]|nr:MAG: protein kinase [Acidobacteriota bacterium]
MSDRDRLEKIAARIGDGEPIDWQDEQRSAAGRSGRLLQRLAEIATVADAHRKVASLSDGEPAFPGASRAEGYPARDPQPQLDGFEILDTVGEGPLGVVYRARDVRSGLGEVALKLIKWSVDIREVSERFTSIAGALDEARHPDIARVHELRISRLGRPLFVMELVLGEPITEFCQTCRHALEERLRLFARLCDAVECVHRAGLAHLRIKPSNILVRAGPTEPSIKLLDLGIPVAVSQWLVEQRIRETSGPSVSLPRYLSPEECAGKHASLDARSDVFALGWLLEELSQPVLASSTPSNARAIERLVGRATDREPSVRYRSAGALGAQLSRMFRRDPAE